MPRGRPKKNFEPAPKEVQTLKIGEQVIECGKSCVKRIVPSILRGIYAKGSGTTGYVGVVQLFTETAVIRISWNKRSGKPYVSIYDLKEPFGMDRVYPDYFQVVDQEGNVFTEWPENKNQDDEEKMPEPLVSTLAERKRRTDVRTDVNKRTKNTDSK